MNYQVSPSLTNWSCFTPFYLVWSQINASIRSVTKLYLIWCVLQALPKKLKKFDWNFPWCKGFQPNIIQNIGAYPGGYLFLPVFVFTEKSTHQTTIWTWSRRSSGVAWFGWVFPSGWLWFCFLLCRAQWRCRRRRCGCGTWSARSERRGRRLRSAPSLTRCPLHVKRLSGFTFITKWKLFGRTVSLNSYRKEIAFRVLR